MLSFPAIDPVAFHVGPLAIRWYALAYVAGILAGWRYARYLARLDPKGPKPELFDDLATWIVLGVLLGGRIGYVLFYNLAYFIAHPLLILMIWKGGMSFHGGVSGVLIAPYFFSLEKKN